MTPTNELRFVEREIKYNEPAMGGDYVISGVRVIKVLQQKVINDLNRYEWRDVPVVKEQENEH
jgi:hypothetical protein